MRGAAVIAAAALACACNKTEPTQPPPAPAAPAPAPTAMPVAAKPVAVEPVAPDAVTAASPKWKAGPAMIVDETIDGAALRSRHHERLAGDDSPVTMLAGGSPSELGERLCEAVVPKRPASTPVLLKPNMGGFNWFHDPKTTTATTASKAASPIPSSCAASSTA